MSAPTNLPERFVAHLRATGILPARSRVLVTVSGHADSVALLALLHTAAPALSLRLHAAHVQTRESAEADAEAARVRDLAAGWNIRSVVRRALALPTTDTGSTAYSSLLDHLRQEVGADLLAIGETQDDAAVALLDALLTSRADRSFYAARAGTLVRPLLAFTHEECVRFLEQERIPFRHAPDALALTSPAQKIRLLILPLLQRHVEPQAARNLAAAGRALAADTLTLDALSSALQSDVGWEETNHHVQLRFAQWRQLPSALRRRILGDAVRRVSPDVPTTATDLAELEARCHALAESDSVTTPGLNIIRRAGILTIARL